MKNFQDGITNLDRAVLIPFQLPLRQNLDYVYTLDLDSAHLTVSFWYREEGDEDPGVLLSMRRLGLDSIYKSSDLSIRALLQDGSNPLLDISAGRGMSQTEMEHEPWEIMTGQPSSLNELQCRMFMDFVYQWRFFIDDHTIWQYPSSTLFRRLCIAFLRLAAWDFEISTDSKIAKLPLGAESFPGWDSPPTEVYWFHGSLVVLCEDLDTPLSISVAVSRARQLIGRLEGRGNKVNCILLSLVDIAFIQVLADKIQCSRIFPLLTRSSATECSAGFRVLSCFLTAPCVKRGENNLSAREVSSVAVPTEVLRMVLNTVTPYDIVSFAQASFLVEEWYYSSLPQLPNIAIYCLDVAIPCCGRRKISRGKEGVRCSRCYVWRHLECLDPSERPQEEWYICSKCRFSIEQAGARPRLMPGAIGRTNRRENRPDGCRVMVWKQEKVLQLRISAPAFMRPELRLKDHDLSSTQPNQTDYVVLFNRSWSGLAFGLDDVDSKAKA